MSPAISVGARRSYDDHLCTVRYYGSVDGREGEWLGVEWDDPTRGKHDGSRGGKRYFDCLSKKPNAASFIRDSKPCDTPREFLTALGIRYGSINAPSNSAALGAIYIGGKEVEEVGFQQNSQRLSAWPSLQIISLDGLQLNGICSEHLPAVSRRIAFEFILHSDFVCQQLDLSRNMFETWGAVLDICNALRSLRDLYVNSNRFKDLRSEAERLKDILRLESLGLADTALDWDTVMVFCTQRRFPTLKSLTLAFNPLGVPSNQLSKLSINTLSWLDLTSCDIESLQTLAVLDNLENPFTLILRSNPLAILSTSPQLFFRNVVGLDLTSTLIANISDLSPIPNTFPLLKSLQTYRTPLANSHPSSRLLTIAFLPQLFTLNNTNIPDHERINAEIYYHRIITSLLSHADTPEQEQRVHSEHPQWPHLCAKYGVPESIQAKERALQSQIQPQGPAPNTTITTEKPYPPISLGANLCTFKLYTKPPITLISKTHTLPIPLLIDIYALKGIVGRLFSIAPMSLRLIHETSEYDPVPVAKPDENDWSCSEDEDSGEDEEEKGRKRVEREEKRKKMWVRREVELVDSTRAVADWIEEKEAKVRVERRR